MHTELCVCQAVLYLHEVIHFIPLSSLCPHTHTVHKHDSVGCLHLVSVTGSIMTVDKCIYIHFFNKKHNIAVPYYSTVPLGCADLQKLCLLSL